MDLAEIQRRAQAARESTLDVDGATFTLRIPTAYETRLACHQVGDGGRAEQLLRVERVLLLGALVGWVGVPLSWVLPDADPHEAYVFSPDAVELLLDARPALAVALGDQLSARMQARAEQQGTAAKN